MVSEGLYDISGSHIASLPRELCNLPPQLISQPHRACAIWLIAYFILNGVTTGHSPLVDAPGVRHSYCNVTPKPVAWYRDSHWNS